jgi:hypothetical protein
MAKSRGRTVFMGGTVNRRANVRRAISLYLLKQDLFLCLPPAEWGEMIVVLVRSTKMVLRRHLQGLKAPKATGSA